MNNNRESPPGPMLSNELQVIGDPMKMAMGAEPVMRAMTLADLDDDCPVCQMNRKRILSGNPPIALVFE